MLYDDGKPHNLFRGAFLQSGSPTPVGSIENGQPVYDTIVSLTGCSGAADTLACIRDYNFDRIAVSPSRFNLPVQPPSDQGSAVIDATSYGNGCIAQQLTDGFGDGIPSSLIDMVENMYPSSTGTNEDCLFVNVIAPAIVPLEGLPVLVWIYGGVFEGGSTSSSLSICRVETILL